MIHQDPVLEGSRFALVGITYDILREAGLVSAGIPFRAGREKGSAHPRQLGIADLFDHLFRTKIEQLAKDAPGLIGAKEDHFVVFPQIVDPLLDLIGDRFRRQARPELLDDASGFVGRQIGDGHKVDQGCRFLIAEPNAGSFEQPELTARIDRTQTGQGSALKCFTNFLQALKFGQDAVVEIDRMPPGRFEVKEMVEGSYAFYLDLGQVEFFGQPP